MKIDFSQDEKDLPWPPRTVHDAKQSGVINQGDMAVSVTFQNSAQRAFNPRVRDSWTVPEPEGYPSCSKKHASWITSKMVGASQAITS